MTRLTAEVVVPLGATLAQVSAQELGDRLVGLYNQRLQAAGIVREGYLCRFWFRAQRAWSYLYWELNAEPLDPGAYVWTPGRQSGDGQRSRSICARQTDADPATDGAAVMRWASGGGVLWLARHIPQDADSWSVPEELIPTRAQTDAAIGALIDARLAAQQLTAPQDTDRAAAVPFRLSAPHHRRISRKRRARLARDACSSHSG